MFHLDKNCNVSSFLFRETVKVQSHYILHVDRVMRMSEGSLKKVLASHSVNVTSGHHRPMAHPDTTVDDQRHHARSAGCDCDFEMLQMHPRLWECVFLILRQPNCIHGAKQALAYVAE